MPGSVKTKKIKAHLSSKSESHSTNSSDSGNSSSSLAYYSRISVSHCSIQKLNSNQMPSRRRGLSFKDQNTKPKNQGNRFYYSSGTSKSEKLKQQRKGYARDIYLAKRRWSSPLDHSPVLTIGDTILPYLPCPNKSCKYKNAESNRSRYSQRHRW